jgi:YfiR/HmsC-like
MANPACQPDAPRGPRSSRRRASIGGGRICALAFAMVVALNGPASLRAQASSPTEYDIEAAYLFNFMRFVEWPPTTMADGSSLHICVLGQDPFGEALDATLAGGSIAGRNVTAVRISEPKESLNCHILFISSSENSRLSQILLALDKTPVLTVSNAPHFVDRGGMIEFTLERGKVRFEVNLAVSSGAGLVLSSDLLKLAKRVKNKTGAGS